MVLQDRLATEGFQVHWLRDAPQVLSASVESGAELVLIEMDLPGIDGFEICRRLRADRRTVHLPVMMLSGEVVERDKVRGFEVGANDFLARPFGLDEFAARVRSLLRHGGGPRQSGVLRAGGIELDLDRCRIQAAGRRVVLTGTQLALLRELMSQPGLTLRRSYLLNRIRNSGELILEEARTIDSHIARIRRKLGPAGKHIVTVRGMGYRFEAGPKTIYR